VGYSVIPRTLPDGRRVTPAQYDEYMMNTYVPGQDFAASAGMPIPGLTGPTTPATQIPGMPQGMPPGGGMPPSGMPMQPPPSFSTPFQSNGPYGLLAQQLAGVAPTAAAGMSGPQMPQGQMPQEQYQGLLGPKRGGFRIPGAGGGK
jgi:hypothetical protein